MKEKENNLTLNNDEQELLDMLISLGLEKILFIAKERLEKDDDLHAFLSFFVEVQCLMIKLGYEFKFKIEEVKDNEM